MDNVLSSILTTQAVISFLRLLGESEHQSPKLNRGGGAAGAKAALLIILLTLWQVSDFIFIFYTHVGVLHQLTVGKRKRASPEMARGVSSPMQRAHEIL